MRRLTRILAALLAAGALLALAPGALAASTTLTGVVQLLHADAPTARRAGAVLLRAAIRPTASTRCSSTASRR